MGSHTHLACHFLVELGREYLVRTGVSIGGGKPRLADLEKELKEQGLQGRLYNNG